MLTAGVDALTVAILAGHSDPSMLASRTFAPWLGKLVANGYRFHLIFLWLPTPDFAVDRVADRVRLGGHSVPEATVRRRYRSGLGNFFRLYRPIAVQSWQPYHRQAALSDPMNRI